MMNSVLNMSVVLVLNRNWQAINIVTPADAFCQMYTDNATALDIRGSDYMVPTRWPDWTLLEVRDDDFGVQTVEGQIRVPTVIVLARYAKVPMKRPKLSSRAIRERDGGRCQYTGVALEPDDGNIDHVVPRSRGGENSWKNCVLASRRVNSRKGNRTPEEAGLKLIRKPRAPSPLPVTLTLKNPHGIEDWSHFL